MTFTNTIGLVHFISEKNIRIYVIQNRFTHIYNKKITLAFGRGEMLRHIKITKKNPIAGV